MEITTRRSNSRMLRVIEQELKRTRQLKGCFLECARRTLVESLLCMNQRVLDDRQTCCQVAGFSSRRSENNGL
jgi:hypothetical protein